MPLPLLGPSLRFIRVSRSFGLLVAMRVAYSKARGVLRLAMALPAAPLYGSRQRQVTILLDTAIHRADVCAAFANRLSARGDGDWEMVVCASFPAAPDIASMLQAIHGKAPWIRVVRADDFAGNESIVQWTVEQATGSVVLLLGRDNVPSVASLSSSVASAIEHVTCDTAVRIDEETEIPVAESQGVADDCPVLIVQKSVYLAMPHRDFSLDAGVVASRLIGSGVSVSRRST